MKYGYKLEIFVEDEIFEAKMSSSSNTKRPFKLVKKAINEALKGRIAQEEAELKEKKEKK